MVNIMAKRQAYRRFEAAATALIAGHKSSSDELSKITGNGALSSLIESRQDLRTPLPWIKRERRLIQTL